MVTKIKGMQRLGNKKDTMLKTKIFILPVSSAGYRQADASFGQVVMHEQVWLKCHAQG